MTALRRFRELVRRRTGISLGEKSPVSLRDEIRRAMSQQGVASPEEYYHLICHNPTEFMALVQVLTIKETYFFREPAPVRLFVERLAPAMLRNRAAGRKIKVLSAGCSTGEEPYSLVMALMEKYGHGIAHTFSVTGADIDTGALAKARQGIYRGQAFRMTSPLLKTRYFSPADANAWQLKKEIRDRVTFRHLNLFDPPYPDDVCGADIIFYRNVSIYFDTEARLTIFRNLSDSLSDGGYMVVSATETLSHNRNILPLIEIDGVFLYHKPVPGSHSGGQPTVSPLRVGENPPEQRPPQTPPSPVNAAPSENRLRKALKMARNKTYADALEVLDALIAEKPDDAGARLLKAGILLNIGQTDATRDICRDVIQANALCSEGHLLLGMADKLENRGEAACRQFRRVLYISPSNWLAHFHMAEIHRESGNLSAAHREYRTVVRLIQNGHFPNHGLTFFPLLFSEARILHLCRHHMKKLSEDPASLKKEER
ncbi:hypothetical protein DENIS_1065 [Desulfonema ishimotonii]|uniref:protein-glutamate O-methyltransferase n=1 Tax=Desulfonema ishimotonii TaxID=45657 RepID=A0A401FT40_9BACT|nr:protein-glutamate O-methyltransferase CheR [Desulfonema ishimotonii]GBC60120.1 hypothetical protein DENIS_1065 [Desulfonema ishimotonii]